MCFVEVHMEDPVPQPRHKTVLGCLASSITVFRVPGDALQLACLIWTVSLLVSVCLLSALSANPVGGVAGMWARSLLPLLRIPVSTVTMLVPYVLSDASQ